jgi:hypothetical protein
MLNLPDANTTSDRLARVKVPGRSRVDCDCPDSPAGTGERLSARLDIKAETGGQAEVSTSEPSLTGGESHPEVLPLLT